MARKRKPQIPPVKKPAEKETKAASTVTEKNSLRVSVIAVSFFILLFSSLTITSFLRKSPTFDESYHLLAGYSHLKWGDFRVYPEHPPLAKLLAALPLLALDVKDPRSSTDWDVLTKDPSRSWKLATQMLFKDNDAETLFFYAKLPMIFLGILLGIFVFLWAKEALGLPAALAALLLYGLDPNILAHSQIAQTDIAFSAFFFIASYFFWRSLRNLNWRDLLFTALFCALATITKFSFVNIFLTWFVLALVKLLSPEPYSSTIILRGEVRTRGGKTLLLGAIFGCALLASYVCIWAVYRFRWDAIPNGSDHFPLLSVMPDSPQQRAIIHWISDRHLFPEAWLYGFLYVFKSLTRSSYLLGAVSADGFWLFFPVAFIVKTPVPTLLLLLLAAGIWTFKRRMRMAECSLLLYILIYFATAVASRLNIGLRHLIPIYPFLFLLLGGAASEIWSATKTYAARSSLLLLGLWYIGSAIYVYPHYLAYFNELGGGPKNGYKILVDSNLDWGQDLKGLKAFMENRGIKRIYLSYFGTADPCYYRLTFTYLPGYPAPLVPCKQDPAETPADFLAISATNLQSVYFIDRALYGWLKDLRPIAQIGYSIFVYDIRRETSAHSNLGVVYLKAGMVEDALREFDTEARSVPTIQISSFNMRETIKKAFGNNSALYLNLGNVYFQKGQLEEAIEQYKQAISLKPDDSEAHLNLGGAYFNKNRIDEAASEFASVLKINPNNAEAHNNLGSAYFKKGLLDQAIEQYKQALSLKPDYPDARNNMNMALQQKSAMKK